MAPTLTQPEQLVANWRTSADDNPAGPLFTTSFTEADLTSAPSLATACSSCSASRTRECC
jgi:uncharacterized protein DUF6229